MSVCGLIFYTIEIFCAFIYYLNQEYWGIFVCLFAAGIITYGEYKYAKERNNQFLRLVCSDALSDFMREYCLGAIRSYKQQANRVEQTGTANNPTPQTTNTTEEKKQQQL